MVMIRMVMIMMIIVMMMIVWAEGDEEFRLKESINEMMEMR